MRVACEGAVLDEVHVVRGDEAAEVELLNVSQARQNLPLNPKP